MSNLGQGLVF